MIKLQESPRIKKIEDKLNCRMADFLYQLHLGDNMMHKEIAEVVNIPRPTITRWFRVLSVPTQSCHRITSTNLTSWLYKTGKLEKRSRYSGPDRRLQSTKAGFKVDFFKMYSAEMAYVLGYFAADGGMFVNSGGSKYIQFASTDKEILIKIKKLLGAANRIGIKKKYSESPKEKTCYLLQLGSKEMYGDLLRLGFSPKKDTTLEFPKVPKIYIKHFVRGYFDGDGSISFGTYKRKARAYKPTFYLLSCFVSGSKDFLEALSQQLCVLANTGKGYLMRKGDTNAYQLSFSTNDTKKLFEYMYTGINHEKDFYLKRKYNRFLDALNAMGA
jgi:hypothetical protein